MSIAIDDEAHRYLAEQAVTDQTMSIAGNLF